MTRFPRCNPCLCLMDRSVSAVREAGCRWFGKLRKRNAALLSVSSGYFSVSIIGTGSGDSSELLRLPVLAAYEFLQS